MQEGKAQRFPWKGTQDSYKRAKIDKVEGEARDKQ